MPLEERELHIIPGHLRLFSVICCVHIAHFIVFCVVFRRPVRVFFPIFMWLLHFSEVPPFDISNLSLRINTCNGINRLHLVGIVLDL